MGLTDCPFGLAGLLLGATTGVPSKPRSSSASALAAELDACAWPVAGEIIIGRLCEGAPSSCKLQDTCEELTPIPVEVGNALQASCVKLMSSCLVMNSRGPSCYGGHSKSHTHEALCHREIPTRWTLCTSSKNRRSKWVPRMVLTPFLQLRESVEECAAHTEVFLSLCHLRTRSVLSNSFSLGLLPLRLRNRCCSWG